MKEICVAFINAVGKICVTCIICATVWSLDDKRVVNKTTTEDE